MTSDTGGETSLVPSINAIGIRRRVSTRQDSANLGNLGKGITYSIKVNNRYTKVKVVWGCLAHKDLLPPVMMAFLLLPVHTVRKAQKTSLAFNKFLRSLRKVLG